MQAQIKDNPNNANAHNYANVGNSQTKKMDPEEYIGVERKKQKKKRIMTLEYANLLHQPPN